jgi:hypothetical protein
MFDVPFVRMANFILCKAKKNFSPPRLRSRRITLSAGTSLFDCPAIDFLR